METPRKTQYATEIATASIANGGIRLERLHIHELKRDEIRFSWWKGTRMMPKPLDVTEDELLEVFEQAIAKGVFTPNFLKQLREILDQTKMTGQ